MVPLNKIPYTVFWQIDFFKDGFMVAWCFEFDTRDNDVGNSPNTDST